MRDTCVVDPSLLARHAPSAEVIAQHAQQALDEDLGPGDLTATLVPAGQISQVEIIAREGAVLCGCAWAEAVFHLLDREMAISWDVTDGQRCAAGQRLCRLTGPSRALLTGERTALNWLQTLSGTATRARRYAEAVAGLPVRILDTRKTLPGLRAEQKYAVLCGGCHNHRHGLYDAILIKENHILAAGSLGAALVAARAIANGLPIEVEVESLAELEEALIAGARHILLDNFDLVELRRAVAVTNGQARLEASGGVDLTTIRAIAETGIDDISVGGLTKDVAAIDLSMRFLAPETAA